MLADFFFFFLTSGNDVYLIFFSFILPYRGVGGLKFK